MVTSHRLCLFCKNSWYEEDTHSSVYICPLCRARSVFLRYPGSMLLTHRIINRAGYIPKELHSKYFKEIGYSLEDKGEWILSYKQSKQGYLVVTAWDPNQAITTLAVAKITKTSTAQVVSQINKGIYPNAYCSKLIKLGCVKERWLIPRSDVYNFLNSGGKRNDFAINGDNNWKVPEQKIDEELTNRILMSRAENDLGARRIQNKSKKIPGGRVQIDICKIASGLYQYTAVDNCTEYQIVEEYSRQTAQNALGFLKRMVEEMPFPIQQIQTDCGQVFFAHKVQKWLVEYSICVSLLDNEQE